MLDLSYSTAKRNAMASLDSLNRNPRISAEMHIFFGTSTCPLLRNSFKLIFHSVFSASSTFNRYWSAEQGSESRCGFSRKAPGEGRVHLALQLRAGSSQGRQLRQPRVILLLQQLHCTPCGCRGRDGASEKFGFTVSDSRECHM